MVLKREVVELLGASWYLRATHLRTYGRREVVDAVGPTLPFYESGALTDRVVTATGTELLLSSLMSLLAAAGPARSAARVDPMEVLRS